jgi:hypothetical protein
VTVNTAIEVTAGGCVFDLGNRSLSIQKTFQMTGLGYVKVLNASSITVTSTGKIKARGDFVEPNGYIVSGGVASLGSTGTISVAGAIDVSGDPAGTIVLVGGGTVTLQNGSSLQGNGITSFVTDGMRFSDGGDIDLESSTGNVSINDTIVATGTRHGAGGVLTVQAAGTISIAGSIDVSGGESDGGDVLVAAGDDITVTKNIDTSSDGGGGFGGEIDLTAGVDSLGGVATGGGVTVTSSDLKLNGSYLSGSAGDGGVLFVTASGLIKFTGAGVGIHASAGTSGDAFGGTVIMDSTDADDSRIGTLDGDISVDGTIVVQSGGTGGFGGDVAFFAGKALTVNATTNVTGEEGGGTFQGSSGGAMAINGAISAQSTDGAGAGGSVELRAGYAQDAALTVTKDIVAAAGANSNVAQDILLSACSLTVGSSVKLDGRAATVGGVPGGATIQLISRHPMQLNTLSQYLATTVGSVQTIHPVGQNPVIGNNVTFNPARTDIATANGDYQPCPSLTPTPTATRTPTPTP